jgi:hypothetical protein
MLLQFTLLLRSEIPDASPQQLEHAARQMGCRPHEVSLHPFLIAPKGGAASAYEEWFEALDVELKSAAVPLQILEREAYAVKVGPELKIANPTSETGILEAEADFIAGLSELGRPPRCKDVILVVPAPDQPNQRD